MRARRYTKVRLRCTLQASERRRITIGSDVFRLTHLYVVPMPAVKVGGEISLKLEGAISSDALPLGGLSTANISLQLVSTSSSSLSKEGPSTGVLVDSHLCSLLGWRNYSDCPVIKRSTLHILKGQNVTLFTPESRQGSKLPGRNISRRVSMI